MQKMRIKLMSRLEDHTPPSHPLPVGKHSGTGIKQITHTPSSGVGSSSTSKPEYEPRHAMIRNGHQCRTPSVKCQMSESRCMSKVEKK